MGSDDVVADRRSLARARALLGRSIPAYTWRQDVLLRRGSRAEDGKGTHHRARARRHADRRAWRGPAGAVPSLVPVPVRVSGRALHVSRKLRIEADQGLSVYRVSAEMETGKDAHGRRVRGRHHAI